MLVELESVDIVFCGGRKTGVPKEKSRSNARTNNKLDPHKAQARVEPGRIVVRGTISPLCHHTSFHDPDDTPCSCKHAKIPGKN